MCGIAGVIDFGGAWLLEEPELRACAEPLRHRGPDAEGYLSARLGRTAVALAHRRLAVIDLSSGGNQPMRSLSGRSLIVFNGEIYNYRELREELVEAGAAFRSRSDTEVLLSGYERWGMDGLLSRIDGMFAFALYDVSSDTVYLVRDPFGKKPCYYRYDPSGPSVAFSSDIRTFRTLGLPLSLDPHALGYYFYELATPEENSIWREVKKVPAGTVVEIGRRGLSARRYWELVYAPTERRSRGEIVEEAEALLRKAVRKRLVADVNVAALLSGGVDSSLVVALMAQEASLPVATYSVGFAEADYNELPYARAVAERCGTRHHELIVRATDIVEADALVHEYGEPFADSSMIPTYAISRELARSEKVVLGGDGGDELFAGYSIYAFAHRVDRVKRLGAAAPIADGLARVWSSRRTRFLAELLRAARGPAHRLLERHMGFTREHMRALFGDEPAITDALDSEHEEVWRRFAGPSGDLLLQLLSASLHTRLVNDYLPKVDRASMYASVEMRSPFLDRELARFAATLPSSEILHGGRSKSILKELAERHVPREVIYRPKQGFSIPVAHWFRQDLRGRLQDVVLGGRQKLVPMNYAWVEQLVERHVAGEDHVHRLWALYVFHVWAQKTAVVAACA